MRNDGGVNYIPHHGVYHPKKPDKLRVVFDCSAKYKGQSLNDHLLQGPNLTNTLIGVLCRFRKEPIAFMCDIEAMFHQLKVDPRHRDFLRFLWWEDGNLNSNPVEFRMNVHLFGATSSPGCANFGLKQAATDHESEFGSEVVHFIHRNFYVDDGLKSLPTDNEAISLIRKTKALCQKVGIRLHKFSSNSNTVMRSLPIEDHSMGMKDINLSHETPHIERALGVYWCVESDTFQFRISLQDKPLTRRGILSTVSSIYDPLGFISPVVLAGKQILQQMCSEDSDWDSPLPESLRSRWERWRNNLHLLEKLEIKRCFKPEKFAGIESVQLHHF